MTESIVKYQKAEIERLKKQNTLLLKKKCKDINTARKIIKSEAIKEFAEKLTDKISVYSKYVDVDGIVILNRIFRMIEDIEKEMTEENNIIKRI